MKSTYVCRVRGHQQVFFEEQTAPLPTTKKPKIDRCETLAQIMGSFEKERSQLAAELYENIAQMLSSASMLMAVGTQTGNQQLLIQSQAILQNVISRIRQVRTDLSIEDLKVLGLKCTLENMVAEKKEAFAIDIKLDDLSDETVLSFEEQVEVFRIVQTALRNVGQHACAKNVQVIIRQSDHIISITIKDDGIGFDKKATLPGGGISCIMARTAMLNGSLTINSEPQKGTTMEVHFRLKQVTKKKHKRQVKINTLPPAPSAN